MAPIIFLVLMPVAHLEVKEKAWAEQCLAQYPEIMYLADAAVRKTEEGDAILDGSYSEQIFGQKFVELDRTLMTLHCMKLILDGGEDAYLQFTEAQPKEVRLSRQSFAKLHLQGRSLLISRYEGLSETEMIRAIEAALVLGDIGKSERAREVFRAYGAKAPDHDDFHGEVMKILEAHPKLSPTFEALPRGAKKILCEAANLAHYGHVTHLEGSPHQMLSYLKTSGVSRLGLEFDFFVHVCDVAGALGHIDRRSSKVYTEQAHAAMQGVYSACMLLREGHTELEAYNAYLSMRASLLGLDPSDQTEAILTRIGAMLRLFTPEEGALLREGVRALDPSVIKAFDVRGIEGGRTPTYMPAVLVNLMNNERLGNSREERIIQAVAIGLPFLAKVLEQSKTFDKTIPLNFNGAAGLAKTAPEKLLLDFEIDQEGNVLPVSR